MRTLGRALAARQLAGVVITVAILTVLGWKFGTVAIPVKLSSGTAPHRIPVAELESLVCGIVVAFLARPRLWQWERLGGTRVRGVATITAAAGIAAALPPIIATATGLPDGFDWSWLLANALIMAAAVQVLVALVGPMLGGGFVVVLYFVDAVLDAVDSGAHRFLPLTAYSMRYYNPFHLANQSGPGPHWLLAGILCALAFLTHWATRGATAWSQRLGHNED